MIHKVEIGSEPLANLIDGKKKCVICTNDRDYQTGDILEFMAPRMNAAGEYKKYHFMVTHVHSGLGLAPGYVVLSLERVE